MGNFELTIYARIKCLASSGCVCTYVQYTHVLTSGRPSALLKINNAKLGDRAEQSKGRTEQRSAHSGACTNAWNTRVQPGVVLTPMPQPQLGPFVRVVFVCDVSRDRTQDFVNLQINGYYCRYCFV